ncbi:MAG: N-acetylneuraminate lyase [Clostridiales bacterium]|nr:N-acetylneuraminate lyase [Clostridiales bacterium]
MKEFKGIFTALLTPFDPQNRINEKALGKLIEHNIKLGVTGFYACGSTAEVFMLNLDERKQLMKLVSDITDSRVTLIAHVGSISADESAELAKYAEELGYDAVSAVAPFYYKFSREEITDYYRDIAEATSLKTIVYNIPAFSGVSLGVDELAEFMRDERFLGIKHTSNDFFTLETIKSQFPQKLVYNGYDEMFLSGLAAGADGGIGSTYNFMADKFIRIRELFLQNKLEEARAIQHEANEIIRILCRIGVNAGEKAIMNLLGLDFGLCRRPFRTCSNEDYALLEREVIPHITAIK